MGLLAACFARTEADAANLGTLLLMPLAFLSGAVFPMPALPLFTEGGETEVGPGSFVYVAPDEEHNFENAGDTPFTFLCVIPAAKFCLR